MGDLTISKQDNNVWVYDIEQFPNFHSFTAYNVITEEVISFTLYNNDLWQLDNYVEFIKTKAKVLVGYNNVNYDYPMIHYILGNYERWKLTRLPKHFILRELFEESQRIVSSEYSAIAEEKTVVPQIDLYRIHHFDNKNKATSLKWVEFAMNWSRVQDLPFNWNHIVEQDQVDAILDYNLNDVMATNEFFKHTMSAIRLRLSLVKEFNNPYLLNANDAKIGSEIFAHYLSIDMGISKQKLKHMRTIRTEMAIKDTILPYIKFESPEFISLLQYLEKQVVTDTKGMFSDIPVSVIGKDLLKHIDRDCIKTKKDFREKVAENLTVMYKGIPYVYGTGGLHAAQRSGIWESDEDYIIADLDVASYYPNLAIKNNIRPEHLGDSFSRIYEELYIRRQSIPKSDPNNYALKIALNGSYGKSGDEHSYFFDKLFTLKICLGGQLSLTMLVEDMYKRIEDCEVIQANTDGVTFRIHRNDLHILKAVAKDWENMTKLELELAYYDKVVMRDVNNYIGIYIEEKITEKDFIKYANKNEYHTYCREGEYFMKKIKHKGCFEIDRAWNKNHSMKIVPIALSKYFIEGIPIEETIKNCTNIYHFCLGAKTKRSWKTILREIKNGEYTQKTLQKTNRYYISKSGSTLMRICDDGRETNVEKGNRVHIFNDYYFTDFSKYKIDYSYYIKEARKVIQTIEGSNQLTLF